MDAANKGRPLYLLARIGGKKKAKETRPREMRRESEQSLRCKSPLQYPEKKKRSDSRRRKKKRS